jgi:hypothetical protein
VPGDQETEDRLPADPEDDVEPGQTPGGVDSATGEQDGSESQNADIPAA